MMIGMDVHGCVHQKSMRYSITYSTSSWQSALLISISISAYSSSQNCQRRSFQIKSVASILERRSYWTCCKYSSPPASTFRSSVSTMSPQQVVAISTILFLALVRLCWMWVSSSLWEKAGVFFQGKGLPRMPQFLSASRHSLKVSKSTRQKILLKLLRYSTFCLNTRVCYSVKLGGTSTTIDFYLIFQNRSKTLFGMTMMLPSSSSELTEMECSSAACMYLSSSIADGPVDISRLWREGRWCLSRQLVKLSRKFSISFLSLGKPFFFLLCSALLTLGLRWRLLIYLKKVPSLMELSISWMSSVWRCSMIMAVMLTQREIFSRPALSLLHCTYYCGLDCGYYYSILMMLWAGYLSFSVNESSYLVGLVCLCQSQGRDYYWLMMGSWWLLLSAAVIFCSSMIGQLFRNQSYSSLRSILSVKSISLRLERVRLTAFYELQRSTICLLLAELGYYFSSLPMVCMYFILLELTSTFSPNLGTLFNYDSSSYCFRVEMVVMPRASLILLELEELWASGNTSLSSYSMYFWQSYCAYESLSVCSWGSAGYWIFQRGYLCYGQC